MVKLLRLLGQLHHFEHGVPKGSGIRRFGARRNRLWVYGFLDLSWAERSSGAWRAGPRTVGFFPALPSQTLSFFWASW